MPGAGSAGRLGDARGDMVLRLAVREPPGASMGVDGAEEAGTEVQAEKGT